MYPLLCLALLLPSAPAQNAPTELLPPGITMEKAAQGWIALYDGETNYGWKTEGNVKIDKGVLTVGGEKEAKLITTMHFGDYELALNYRLEGNNAKFNINGPIELKGEEASTSFKEFTVTSQSSGKSLPLIITTNPGTTLHIKSIILKPLGTKSIFNGKDLTGWKEISGKKSKFSVNSNGELNVKDGPGDLQTTDQWDDFVLQLDIYSNGDHLNSGVFYRCLPNDFWSGYEAQVRNEWKTTVKLKNGKTYTDSVTIKGDKVSVKSGRTMLTFDKSEIESMTDHRDKPIDIGSGGIYNRCEARKVVSTDREWYTMTVLAHGNHMAVWVNGFQTADFTDMKPISRSARQGRKDDAGPLSIQGHDPTTDLNFKNIRIAPLAK